MFMHSLLRLCSFNYSNSLDLNLCHCSSWSLLPFLGFHGSCRRIRVFVLKFQSTSKALHVWKWHYIYMIMFLNQQSSYLGKTGVLERIPSLGTTYFLKKQNKTNTHTPPPPKLCYISQILFYTCRLYIHWKTLSCNYNVSMIIVEQQSNIFFFQGSKGGLCYIYF